MKDKKHDQVQKEQNKQNEEFFKWLSPSHWQTEGQLADVRVHRAHGSLQWALTLKEFQDWQLADIEDSPKNRILWIKGPLGVGKSILAGYYIELLKCQYPKAIIAYFFCRANTPCLMTARDIIRTLTYQCIEGDGNARSMLDELKRKDFEISDNVGVLFLFEKLLLEPLRRSQKDIYIVLDGLDEADISTVDKADRTNLAEMKILLSNLARLPSSRLLFVSRPQVANIIPSNITKMIGKYQNQQDIDAYVREFIADPQNLYLRSNFANEKIDPVKYFHNKANGIFLWTVLVLQELAKAKSKNTFLESLQKASEASGSMDKLYITILSRIKEDDRKWVQEILRWVIGAKRQLSVNELQTAVEWCLNDTHTNFQDFLEVECGAMLHLIPIQDNALNVQPIHETFQSFLLDSNTCPRDFLIDKAFVHNHIASTCLQYLLADQKVRNGFPNYAASNWSDHLNDTTPDARQRLECSLVFRLFNTGMTNWLNIHDPDNVYPNAYWTSRKNCSSCTIQLFWDWQTSPN